MQLEEISSGTSHLNSGSSLGSVSVQWSPKKQQINSLILWVTRTALSLLN